MPPPYPPSLAISLATPEHIPALIALLLTSFRQFSLFSSLYSPLDENLDYASDTVWFWTRRLQLELLDPDSSVIVAEISGEDCWWESDRARVDGEQYGDDDVDGNNGRNAYVKAVNGRKDEEEEDEVQQRSWAMLDWVRRKGGMEQRDIARGTETVGFAIWKVRGGAKTSISPEVAAKKQDIEHSILERTSQQPRRDQDPAKYAAYLLAEAELEERFYTTPPHIPIYYLDNLAVDFRLQRRGIGAALVAWGLTRARELDLPAGTEAGEKGEGLYRKMGFVEVGSWMVQGIRMPVLRREKEKEKEDEKRGGEGRGGEGKGEEGRKGEGREDGGSGSFVD